MKSRLKINSVEDETSLFNFGEEVDNMFYSIERTELGLSYYD